MGAIKFQRITGKSRHSYEILVPNTGNAKLVHWERQSPLLTGTKRYLQSIPTDDGGGFLVELSLKGSPLGWLHLHLHIQNNLNMQVKPLGLLKFYKSANFLEILQPS